MSDKSIIDRELTPVPYEDGDHCIFYAAQEASLFFNKTGLTINDRKQLETKKNRVVKLGMAIIGENTESLHWLTASIRIMASKLRESNVVITEIVSDNQTITEVKKDHFIQRSGISTKIINGEEDYNLTYPTLLYIWGQDGTHVWCCTSEEKFKENYDENIGPENDIVLVANIKSLK